MIDHSMTGLRALCSCSCQNIDQILHNCCFGGCTWPGHNASLEIRRASMKVYHRLTFRVSWPLFLKISRIFTANHQISTFPMPDLWHDSCTQKSRMHVGLSSLTLPIYHLAVMYEITVKQIFLAHTNEPQDFIIFGLDVNTVVRADKFYRVRYYLFQSLSLGRQCTQSVKNRFENLQRLFLIERLESGEIVFTCATNKIIGVSFEHGFHLDWKFHLVLFEFFVIVYNYMMGKCNDIIQSMQRQFICYCSLNQFLPICMCTELVIHWQLIIMQTFHNSNILRIKVELERIVASKQAHFFVVVQLKKQSASSDNKTIKYRTETSALTNRPRFNKNLFNFSLDHSSYTLKFGLMLAKSQLDEDVTSAMVFGVCSLPITSRGLKQSKDCKFENQLIFVDRGKEIGKFNVRISFSDKEYKLNDDGDIFDPLLSRVLYTEQCADSQRLAESISLLQSQLQKLYLELLASKKQQNFFEKLYLDLEQDEKQLRDEIDSLQKINSTIEHKLQSAENMDNLKIQIDMLSTSEEGKKVLIQKLEYFQDRIYRQIEQNEKLAIEYKRIRPEIQQNLKKAETHAQKLKGKQLQQFQLQNNDKILQSYSDILYQFKVHEQTIKSLSKMSQRSELTAKQAKLLLSQVNYEIKLNELGADQSKKVKNNQILKYIEKEIEKGDQQQKQLSEQEQVVYKIKYEALKREIEEVRRKLHNIANN